jgi:hypothetical protein
MARKKGKSPSFDAMVKFFMQSYDIPTKKDVNKLMAKLDHLENLIKASGKSDGKASTPRGRGISLKGARMRSSATAFDRVLEVIRGLKQGAGLAEIQARTAFDEKKIRNIIFRLHKSGKIKRKSRGIYIAT